MLSSLFSRNGGMYGNVNCYGGIFVTACAMMREYSILHAGCTCALRIGSGGKPHDSHTQWPEAGTKACILRESIKTNKHTNLRIGSGGKPQDSHTQWPEANTKACILRESINVNQEQ